MVHYPVEFPADAASTIVGLYRAGSLAQNRAEAAECLWNLQGYAMACALGSVQPPQLSQSLPPHINDTTVLSNDEVIGILEEHAKQSPEQKMEQGLLPLPYSLILKWATQMLAEIIGQLV